MITHLNKEQLRLEVYNGVWIIFFQLLRDNTVLRWKGMWMCL